MDNRITPLTEDQRARFELGGGANTLNVYMTPSQDANITHHISADTINQEFQVQLRPKSSIHKTLQQPVTNVDNPGTLSRRMYKTKKPTDMDNIYDIRPFSGYILKDNPAIIFLLYDDNFQHVVTPQEEAQKYLTDSGIPVSELVLGQNFSRIKGNNIDWKKSFL